MRTPPLLPILILASCTKAEPVLLGWEWTERSTLPETRWGMPATHTDVGQLAFGGSNGTGSERTTDTLWTRVPADDTWTSAEPAEPGARYCHCATLLPDANKLLVVGGRDDTAPVDDAWVYDLSTQNWAPVEGDALSHPIGCHAAWIDDQAWVFGGGDATSNSAAMWSYDPDLNTFTEVEFAEAPSARRDATTVVADDRWLLFGGQAGAGDFLNDLWAFDGTAWQQLAADSPLLPRRYAASGWHPDVNRWVVHGGTDDTQDMADTWVLDTDTLQWTELTLDGGPDDRAFATSGFDGTGIYVAGGLRVATSTALDDAWRLDAIVE